jgi:FlaA1/EpsC-like NDP-sugar epimerase
VVVASTDKAALAASFYGRTKRLMEGLAADAAARAGAPRAAVRLVNVLGSAGSASELFLRQVRGGVPLTITDTGMLRFWITMAHTVALVAQTALLADEGVTLATAAEPVELTVGELADRIWTQAAGAGAPEVDLLGVRPGETMREVLTGDGETLGPERHQGIVEIQGHSWAGEAGRALAEIPGGADRTTARPAWREAMERTALAPP